MEEPPVAKLLLIEWEPFDQRPPLFPASHRDAAGADLDE
jgi:hypothetical protein